MFTFIYIVIMLFVTASLAAMYLEKRDFNDGICKICGNLLRNFDDDSQGGRGYCCDECGYETWVSYHYVDKDF